MNRLNLKDKLLGKRRKTDEVALTIPDTPPKRGRWGRLAGRLPGSKMPDSGFLVPETQGMHRRRREAEQAGLRRFGRVNAREHSEEMVSAPEGELQNSILQHPSHQSQNWDGADINVSSIPPLNSTARKDFDNAQREQDKDKQNRLENQLELTNAPRFSSAPRPSGM